MCVSSTSQQAEVEEGGELRTYPGMDHLGSYPWSKCSSEVLTCFQLFHPGFRKHRNTEWFCLGCKGPERPASSNLTAMGREPCTRSGGSEPIQPVWSNPSLHPHPWLSRFWALSHQGGSSQGLSWQSGQPKAPWCPDPGWAVPCEIAGHTQGESPKAPSLLHCSGAMGTRHIPKAWQHWEPWGHLCPAFGAGPWPVPVPKHLVHLLLVSKKAQFPDDAR